MIIPVDEMIQFSTNVCDKLHLNSKKAKDCYAVHKLLQNQSPAITKFNDRIIIYN